MNYTYNVDVIYRVSGISVKNIVVTGMNKAEKVSKGLQINLNSAMYFVRIERKGE